MKPAPHPHYEACLPASARALRERIGLAALQKLVAARGGSRVYVPMQPEVGCTLARLIGHEAARALAAEYGGEHIEIPKCDAALRALRDAELQKRIEAGESVSRVALDAGLTERHLRRILAQARQAGASRQKDLFE